MSAHSKKETENMYGGMFRDLSALASDDTGEINSFANDVINREVNAGAGWRRRFVDNLQLGLRHKGDIDKFRARKLFDEQQQIKGTLEAVENGWFNRVMKDPSVLRIFDTEIDKQAQDLVRLAIQRTRKKDAFAAKKMNDMKGYLADRVKAEIISSVKGGKITDNNVELIVNVNKQVRVGKDIDPINIDKISLNRSDFQNRINEIKIKETEINKNVDEVEKRINARKPVAGDTKVANGKKWYFNGKTWLLIGAAGTLLLGKDKLQGAYESMGKGNQEVEVGPKTNSPASATESPSSSSGYDAGASHETSPDVMNNLNPGGPNTTQVPKAYGQDAWDKFKTTPPAQRRRFDFDSDYENGWWNAPTTSKPTYDDMGYIGGSDESWSRTAQKSTPGVDELDDSALSDYGADQVLAAQNFLSYYGLGTDKQPGRQIIESLLMGNFDGKSFEEYKSTHSEDEVRHAMKRFEQGLSMFSTEMGKLAHSLESFYQERQRRIESEKSKPVQPNEQPNEQPERTE